MNALARKIATLEKDLGIQSESFWCPLLFRWALWLGCAWSIGSVILFAPLLSRLLKKLL